MSTRDEPSLSEREQAILDRLAAKAAADDPSLAAALRGRRRLPQLRLPAMPAVLRHWVWGLVLALVGLALTVLAMSAGLLVGVVGVVAAMLGVGRVITAAPWVPFKAGPEDGAGD